MLDYISGKQLTCIGPPVSQPHEVYSYNHHPHFIEEETGSQGIN